MTLEDSITVLLWLLI